MHKDEALRAPRALHLLRCFLYFLFSFRFGPRSVEAYHPLLFVSAMTDMDFINDMASRLPADRPYELLTLGGDEAYGRRHDTCVRYNRRQILKGGSVAQQQKNASITGEMPLLELHTTMSSESASTLCCSRTSALASRMRNERACASRICFSCCLVSTCVRTRMRQMQRATRGCTSSSRIFSSSTKNTSTSARWKERARNVSSGQLQPPPSSRLPWAQLA